MAMPEFDRWAPDAVIFVPYADNPFVDETAMERCYRNPLLMGIEEGQRKVYFLAFIDTFVRG